MRDARQRRLFIRPEARGMGVLFALQVQDNIEILKYSYIMRKSALLHAIYGSFPESSSVEHSKLNSRLSESVNQSLAMFCEITQ